MISENRLGLNEISPLQEQGSQQTMIRTAARKLLRQPGVHHNTRTLAPLCFYSTAPPPPPAGSKTVPSSFQVFNREAKRMQKERAASNAEESRQVDYVKDEVAFRVVDRLLDIRREFNEVVELGSGCGHIAKHVDTDMMKKLIMCDMSETMLNRDVDTKYEGISRLSIV